jgi:hypothetical protein
MWYLGGHTITGVGWDGPRSIAVEFQSTYLSGWLWQLYAGRRRIGTTSLPTQRRIGGQLILDGAPAPLTLIRVPVGERLADYGAEIPPLPWNRFVLGWRAESFPADTHRFQIAAAREPGGEVDPGNILAEPPYAGPGPYTLMLPPLARSGEWTYRITPYDDARPLGNPGTPSDVVVTALVPPPDFVPQADGQRFSVAVEADTLRLGFSYGRQD